VSSYREIFIQTCIIDHNVGYIYNVFIPETECMSCGEWCKWCIQDW